jgi:hypothetical protein
MLTLFFEAMQILKLIITMWHTNENYVTRTLQSTTQIKWININTKTTLYLSEDIPELRWPMFKFVRSFPVQFRNVMFTRC